MGINNGLFWLLYLLMAGITLRFQILTGICFRQGFPCDTDIISLNSVHCRHIPRIWNFLLQLPVYS